MASERKEDVEHFKTIPMEPLPDDDDLEPYCQGCHSSVDVKPGSEWEKGDMCDNCTIEAMERVLNLHLNARSPSAYIEAMQETRKVLYNAAYRRPGSVKNPEPAQATGV